MLSRRQFFMSVVRPSQDAVGYLLMLEKISTSKDEAPLCTCPYMTSPNVYLFSINVIIRLDSKFAIKSVLNIPRQLKRVAMLPCEIFCVRKLTTVRNTQTHRPRYVQHPIDDKSQGRVPTRLNRQYSRLTANVLLSLPQKDFLNRRTRVSWHCPV